MYLEKLKLDGRVAVVTDSACDLPDAVLEPLGVTVVPLRAVSKAPSGESWKRVTFLS